jgi:hypothetical protein
MLALQFAGDMHNVGKCSQLAPIYMFRFVDQKFIRSIKETVDQEFPTWVFDVLLLGNFFAGENGLPEHPTE